MSFCPNCGSEIIDGAKFCMNCGLNLTDFLNLNSNECKKVYYNTNDVESDLNLLDSIYSSENGNQIKMIKKLREVSGMDLKDAKETIENYLSTKNTKICAHCNRLLRIETKQNRRIGYCDTCKTAVYLENTKIKEMTKQTMQKPPFNGIYRYTLLGKKEEVYCPRCGSSNCSHYKEQKVIPGKTKTTYSANINPLKPFTLVNKKEKVVRKDQVITENKFICNSCGKIFN